jgi:hypothetical protein
MAKLRRKTIYTISMHGWFKDNKAMHRWNPELESPYSSVRVVRTASKLDRIANSLIKAGFELEHTDRRICWYRNGVLIRVDYSLVDARKLKN